MKRPIINFSLLMLPILASAATIQKTHTITFDESDFIFDYTQHGELTIAAPQKRCVYPETEGELSLPKIVFRVLAPAQIDFAEMDYSFASYNLIDDVTISKSVAPCIIGGDAEIQIDVQSEWSTDVVEFSMSHIYGEKRLISFMISPFEYDESTGTLSFRNEITLNLTLKDCPDAVVEETGTKDFYTHLAREMADVDLFPEPKRIVIPGFDITPRTVEAYPDNSNNVDYIILTHPSLMAAFEPLAEWKRSKGGKTEIVDVLQAQTTNRLSPIFKLVGEEVIIDDDVFFDNSSGEISIQNF